MDAEQVEKHLDHVEAELIRRCLDHGEFIEAARRQWPQVVLDDFQVDIVRSIFDPQIGEVFIKGCTGAGKGASVALAANLWFFRHDPSKIIISSTSSAHATAVMLGEIAAWRRAMRHPGPGRVLTTAIEHHGQHYIHIANPDTGEGFSGHHGPATLFLFDEASAVPEEFYDLSVTQAKKIVALSNPRSLSGWFRKAFPVGNPNVTQTIQGRLRQRRCITISGLDCRNVREGRAIIPNQIDRARFDAIMANPDPMFRRVFGLAEFPEEDADKQLIRYSWLARHEQEWTANGAANARVTGFGLDVAASEYGDETVLAAGSEWGVVRLHSRKRTENGDNPADTMQTVAWVILTARQRHGVELIKSGVPVVVDADGVGKGVADRLHELGVTVICYRGNDTPDNSKQYHNRRAEGYGELARRLDPLGAFSTVPFALPPDDKLREDLCAPEKIYGSDAMKFKITPKTRQPGMSEKALTIQDKLGRSPDRGDAVVYLYHGIRQRHKQIPPRVHRDIVYYTPGDDALDELSWSERFHRSRAQPDDLDDDDD